MAVVSVACEPEDLSTLRRTSVGRIDNGGPRGTGRAAKDGSMSDRINPHPGILLYTRIKKSPYYYGSRRHGVALYSVYNHHYHPRHYGDPIAEYWQLLQGVTVCDVGVRSGRSRSPGPTRSSSPTC